MGILDFLKPKREEEIEIPLVIDESDLDSLFVSTLEQLTGTTFTGNEKDLLQESIKAFKNKDDPSARKILLKAMGEGFEDYRQIGYGNVATGSFNLFYKSFIDRTFQNEIEKIKNYRSMAEAPEIADVIEDVVNEATMLDEEGKTIHLEIVNEKLSGSKNIADTLNKEFEDFFYKNININDRIWEFFKTYIIDGRLYLERVINEKNQKTGLLNLKKLPSESMDFFTDPQTGQITAYLQSKDPKAKRPLTVEEAEKDSNFIVFHPSQICFVDYGIYGQTRRDILGYLEKCKVPFNQLKLLETSVVIYRIIRAPERLVFSIDTGNMPRSKAMKFVEKVKNSMLKKQTYDPQTGRLTHNPDIFSLLENIYLPRSSEGRGSEVTTVGGNPSGFTELSDLYYFARKLYRSLKYPISRVSAGEEKREADSMFGGTTIGEIARDEVKWARFLERQQDRICSGLRDSFLIHLDFKGLRKQYNIQRDDLDIYMNPPSHYKEDMEQKFLEVSFSNYTALADREEFSRYYLMKKYLNWSEDEIKENKDGMKKDLKLGFRKKEPELDINGMPITTPGTSGAEAPSEEQDLKDSEL